MSVTVKNVKTGEVMDFDSMCLYTKSSLVLSILIELTEVVDPFMLFTFLGAFLDQYAVEHEMSAEEIEDFTQALYKIMLQVHEEKGMPEPYKKVCDD